MINFLSFRTKIFLAVFVPSLILLSLLSASIGYIVAKQMRAEYIERYRNLTSVISDTLQQLEQSAEVLARAGAKYLSLYYEKNGLPSEEKLKELAKNLGVSQMWITDRNGHPIRDTADSLQNRNFSLFQFCSQYHNLINGSEQEKITPIVASYPKEDAYKLVMLPAHNFQGIIEAGVRLNSIGNILKKSIQSDHNLIGLGIFIPNGKRLGYWGGADLQSVISSLSEKKRTEYIENGNLIIVRKVATPQEYCCECITKHLTDSNNRYFYLLVSKVSLNSLQNSIKMLKILLVAVLLGSVIIAFLLANYLSKYLVKRINTMGKIIKNIMDTHDLNLKVDIHGKDEISELAEHFNQMTATVAEAHQTKLDMEKAKALEKLTKQVAHDLGSPLISLNTCLSKLSQIPENTRLIIREAIIRIRDIANDLFERHNIIEETEKKDDKFFTELLTPIIESIVTEKRMQFHSQHNIKINFIMEQSYYGLFVAVQPSRLKRVLSNLINNAIESIEHKNGHVDISLVAKDKKISIIISDNGKGIPPDILEKLKKEGISYGKKDGHGLGLRHAFESLVWWDGTLDVQSTLDRGTTITLTLPLIESPSWFVSQLIINVRYPVVVLDDDTSIHHVWETRLENISNLIHCYNVSDFSKTIEKLKQENSLEKTKFLCDYELSSEKKTGLDLIIQYNLNEQAILVSSRSEEIALRQRCMAMNIRFSPKSLVSYMPIKIVDNFEVNAS